MEPQEGGLRPDALKHSHLSRQEEQPVDVKKYANNPNTKQPISQSLRNAIAADSKWDQQADQTISDAIFSEVEEQILADLSKLKHPYHDKHPTQNVIAGVTELAELAGLDEAEKQLLRVAALFHDYDHAGNTFRQTVADAVRNDISNEEYAAIKADEAVGQYLSVPQRLQLQGIILATSFAQSNPDNLPDSSYQRDLSLIHI